MELQIHGVVSFLSFSVLCRSISISGLERRTSGRWLPPLLPQLCCQLEYVLVRMHECMHNDGRILEGTYHYHEHWGKKSSNMYHWLALCLLAAHCFSFDVQHLLSHLCRSLGRIDSRAPGKVLGVACHGNLFDILDTLHLFISVDFAASGSG
ncbi:hypothetical protein IWX49DRAFT_564152 [Phyllosticta citricarpa]|uniref:Secreted protein n=2 Tax=Phyllosticta TaxID=121621 RepID=A0ABR1MJ67_9PEZI